MEVRCELFAPTTLQPGEGVLRSYVIGRQGWGRRPDLNVVKKTKISVAPVNGTLVLLSSSP